MFENFIVIAKMQTPVATISHIALDALISAAKAKEILQDKYYDGSNDFGTKEQIDENLCKILDKKQGVYCASYGFGDHREYLSSWSKRWHANSDFLIKPARKSKHRVDSGAGYFKSYHVKMVIKSYSQVLFYARGDKQEVKRILDTYIASIGSKRGQGYGKVKEWEFVSIDEDYSLFKGDRVMRNIPIENLDKDMTQIKEFTVDKKPIIPPYFREDNIKMCVLPK